MNCVTHADANAVATILFRRKAMKKTKEVLFVLSVLCMGLMLLGCSSGGSSIKESTLTIQNSPAGYSFTAQVYSSSTKPYTQSDFNGMTTSGIAVGSGNSSINLIWPYERQSGNHLVVLRSGSTQKFDIVNFDRKGDATVNWNVMTDVSALPY